MADTEKPGVQKFYPLLNKELCKRCGICLQFCPGGVWEADEDDYPSPCRPKGCLGCSLCFHWCPDFAIEVKKVEENDRS